MGVTAVTDLAQLARDIDRAARLEGHFVLRSGAVSHEYFDKYRFESDPGLLHRVAAAMAPRVPAGTRALAGLEMGGIPLAVALSRETGLPARFVRKQAKEYGTCNLAEGGPVEGLPVLIVEDVITSGGQVIESAAELRERGALVTHVLCAIDRESGGRERLAEAGLDLIPLLSMSQLRAARTSA